MGGRFPLDRPFADSYLLETPRDEKKADTHVQAEPKGKDEKKTADAPIESEVKGSANNMEKETNNV